MKIVLFASYFLNTGYVGRNRLLRFIRSLQMLDAVDIVVVAAGERNRIEYAGWGTLVTHSAFQRFSPDARCPKPASADTKPGVKPRKAGLMNMLHRLFVYPDMSVLWSLSASANAVVRAQCRGADWVISSSPPESVHVGAHRLSRHLGASWMMDMRDGWLDEPLNPWLKSDAFRPWIESRMESAFVRHASCVTVTSEVWKTMLEQRIEGIAHKVHVLMNAAPDVEPSSRPPTYSSGDRIRLLHAGSLEASSRVRTAERFYSALETLIRAAPGPVEVVFAGNLRPHEKDILKRLTDEVSTCDVRCRPPVSHAEALAEMQRSHGLLLLSNSKAAIPSKLFDYLAAGRPVFTVADPADSALWGLCESIPAVHRFDWHDPDSGINAFYRDIVEQKTFDYVPDYTEASHAACLIALLERRAQVSGPNIDMME